MKKLIVSLVLGIIITVGLAMTTPQPSWSDLGAVCPGISYPVNGDLDAGFPVHYTVSNVPVMGTCGTVTSITFRGRMEAVLSPIFLVNLAFWTSVILVALYIFQKPKEIKTKLSKANPLQLFGIAVVAAGILFAAETFILNRVSSTIADIVIVVVVGLLALPLFFQGIKTSLRHKYYTWYALNILGIGAIVIWTGWMALIINAFRQG